MLPVVTEMLSPKASVFILNSVIPSIKNEYPDLKSYFIDLFHSKFYIRLQLLMKIPLVGQLIFMIISTIWLTRKFKRYKFDLMVLSDDRKPVACMVLKACKKLNIHTVLYPVESFQQMEARIDEKIQHHKVRHENFFLRFANFVFPNNFKKKGTLIVFWYDPLLSVMGKLANVLSKNPWIRGGNEPDWIAVQSKVQFEENLKNNIPENKQLLVGFPPHDILKMPAEKDLNIGYENISMKSTSSAKKKALVLGTTYYQLDKSTQDFSELYTETKKVVQALVDELHSDYDFIFKIHPRESLEVHIQFLGHHLANKLTFADVHEDTYSLIRESDLILLNLSATVVGALATNSPIITYNLGNVHHFHSFYEKYASVKRVTNIEQLRLTLRKIKENKLNITDELTARQRDREYFGCFDGFCTDRFIDLIKKATHTEFFAQY
jgi:hypothetical protein